MTYYLIVVGTRILLIYLATMFLFDILLRGFTPFFPSRPWVVKQILDELEIPQKNPKFLALSTGRSGFFHALEKKYPNAEYLAVEPGLFPYIVSVVQSWVRRSKIKIVHTNIQHVRYKDFDFIYSHLNPDKMRGLGKKMKFDCKTGTQIVSTGFNFASLNAKKIVPLPDRKGRLDWFSKNQKLFQSKAKKFKKEKKAFFYEV